MNIDQLMTREIATCGANDTVREVALKMKHHGCGLIPVIEENGYTKPIGVITDRDITCRVVAPGKDADQTTIKEVMTNQVLNINYQASLNAAMKTMEKNRVRRLVVTNDNGGLIGILSLTDLAHAAAGKKLGKTFKQISQRDSSAGK